MKIKELLKTDKNTKELLKLISTILGIIAVVLTAITLIYQFGIYLYEIQWFNYWGINETFYVKNSSEIINELMYGFSIVCILMILSIVMYKLDNNKKSTKKDWITFFLFFLVINGLLGIKTFYRNGFSLEYIFAFLTATVVSFLCIRKFANKTIDDLIKIKETKDLDVSLQDLALTSLITIIITFAFVIIWGNVNTLLKKEYMIIQTEEKCEVILYTGIDYYIVSDCIIDSGEKTLKINNTKQTKIDNSNVTYEYKIFKSVKKK